MFGIKTMLVSIAIMLLAILIHLFLMDKLITDILGFIAFFFVIVGAIGKDNK